MKELNIKISKDGQKIDIDAEGFTGSGCKDFARKTIEALGTVKEEKKKESYYGHQGSGVHVGA
uniref:DUF2997 domain-containing protein n=1 Tax=viral metagenome TaxID=1070528 RepID=A0A6M3MB14_9ZZZZ